MTTAVAATSWENGSREIRRAANGVEASNLKQYDYKESK